MPGQPTNGEVDGLLAEDKVITANLRWRPEGRRYKLEASVLTEESIDSYNQTIIGLRILGEPVEPRALIYLPETRMRATKKPSLFRLGLKSFGLI